MELRRATAADSDYAFNILSVAFKPYIEEDGCWDEDHQRRQHHRRFATYDYRVIYLGGVARAVMSLDLTQSCIKVNQLFLAPEHQEFGIGARCMALILEQGARSSLPIRLNVMKVNPRAMAFYLRLGFRTIEETQSHFVLER